MLYTFDELCREVRRTADAAVKSIDKRQPYARYVTEDAKLTMVGNTFLRLLRVGVILYDDLQIRRNVAASDVGLLGASDHGKMLQLMRDLSAKALADYEERVKAEWTGDGAVPLTSKTGNFEGFE